MYQERFSKRGKNDSDSIKACENKISHTFFYVQNKKMEDKK